ncbi:MAG: type II secretion system protein M [Desulfobacterales bacterium]|jgi:general secretion pathway protein M|nr:type II secretion system protein M [Desulfobacterales bacterium]
MTWEAILKRINLNKLSRREKIIVAAGGAALILFALVQLLILPVFEYRTQLRRSVQAKSAMLAQMQQFQAEAEGLKSHSQESEERFRRRSKNFTLFSFLDQLAGQARVKERVSYMRPAKIDRKNSPLKLSRVEMKLEGVTLEQLTAYIHGVESSPNMVSVTKLSITRRDQKEGLLDAILQVDTLEA